MATIVFVAQDSNLILGQPKSLNYACVVFIKIILATKCNRTETG
jgi:hypothetical protein